MYTMFGTLQFLDFDKPGYLKTRDEALKVQMRNAAREWLKAVIPKVPVWTGTAIGTLQPLGRYLRVAVPISPVVERENKGPGFGDALGGFDFDDAGNTYTFEFTNFLAYFKFNDQNNANAYGFHLTHDSPWHAMDAGQAAFEKYIEDVLPQRMPNIADFIVVTASVF
jgi:hypothetical protein